MTNPLLVQIERCEASIREYQGEVARLEDEARADDGVVDENDEEFEEIQAIGRQIVELERVATEKQQEFDNNRLEWDGIAREVAALRENLATLTDWGDPSLGPLNDTVAEMDASSGDECYRDAINHYNTAQRSIDPKMEEYQRQYEAMQTYEEELGQAQGRVDALRDADVSTDMTRSTLDQIDTNFESAAYPTNDRDYVEALSLLRMGEPEIVRLETEVERLQVAKADTEASFSELEARTSDTETEAAEFETLLPRFDQLHASENEIRNYIANCEFAEAQGTIDSSDYEVDAIIAQMGVLQDERDAEAERIAAERTAWEQRSARWSEFQRQLDELLEWEDPEAANPDAIRNEINELVTNEEFAQASERLEQAESAISTPWQEHQRQVAAKTTYDGVIPDLDRRASEATASPFADEVTENQMASTDTALQRVHELADGRDFIAANEETSTISQALDQTEQTLRENEIRAAVEAEMGGDGNSSDPEIENEVKRRLYEEERGVVEGRIDSASQTDVAGAEIEAALSQLNTDLDSITALAEGGDYDGALEGVRTAMTEVGRVEELIRDQQELKGRYETAFTAFGYHANCLMTCEINSVSQAAQTLVDGSSEAEDMAAQGDYTGALELVERWEAELVTLDQRDVELHALKDQAQEALSGLSSRIDEVRGNTHEEIQPAADMIVSKVTEIEELMTNEEFSGAITEIDGLSGMLTEFEEEADRAKYYQRYSDAVLSLGIDVAMTEVRACTFPEMSDTIGEVEALDDERTGAAEQSDWETACAAAYRQSEKVGQYRTEVAAIGMARDLYTRDSPAFIAESEEMFEGVPEDDGVVVSTRATIDAHRQQMETTASEERYLAAVELMNEFMTIIEEGKLNIRDAFQASESVINDWISGKMNDARGAVMGGMLTAINRFRIDVLTRITSERDFQTAARYAGYYLDVSSAWVSIIPGGGDIAGAIYGTAKVGIEIAATELDNAMDNADQAAANEMIEKLHAERIKLNNQWRSDIGPWYKSNKADIYQQLGHFLYAGPQGDPSAADALLRSTGVPTAASSSDFHDAYHTSLMSQFEKDRGR
ncbi:MAG: hypothetical protein AB8B60_08990 [Sulfitobacter sp.]